MIKKLKVGVVSCLMDKANINPFHNLVRVLYGVTENLSVISIYSENLSYDGLKKESVYSINHKFYESPPKKIVSFLSTQIKVALKITSLSDTNFWVFYICEYMILPILTAKILRKKVSLLLGGFIENELSSHSTKLYYILVLFKKINLMLADNIILYSPILIKSWDLEKYRKKIVISHEHYINFSEFCQRIEYCTRNNVIGYIGRFSKEKGMLNLLQSIPLIIRRVDNIKFLIVGDGPLRKEIELYLVEKQLEDRVKLVNWVPHDQLPDYLNEIKLLLLPSYTEGLPNIILESMACGTPALSTPVGAIPDILEDEKTGFIMMDNSPECIARNVIRALTGVYTL